MRPALLALMFVAIAALGAVAYRKVDAGEWHVEGHDHVHLKPIVRDDAVVAKKIWLDRDGATLTAGRDDSTRGVSSIVAGAKKDRVTIPAFKGSDKQWKAIVGCIKDQYARFDVEIVETQPEERGYVHVVIGGSPSVVGYGKTIGGLAPYSGQPIPDPVVMVFSRALGEKLRPICETAAMEIAHAYGLDHVYLCKDPMSYLTGCGAKTFQDKSAPCGEKKARACGDGRPEQNSVARLAEVLGPRATR